MAGLGYKLAFTTDASNFRLGRNTVKRDRSTNVRFWLRLLKNSLNGPDKVDP